MRRPASSSLLRSVGLLAQAMVAGSVALLALACGGSTDTDLGSAGGTGGAGTAGTTAAGTGGTAAKVCTPGQQVSCPCPGSGDNHGVQVCKADGSAYDACSGCPGAGGSAGTSSTGGAAGTGAAGTGAAGSGVAGTGPATGGQAGAPPSECGTCIDDNCASQVATCEADAECAPLYQCVLDQCSDATSTGQLAVCAFQKCGANQQSGQKVLPVSQCASQQCKGKCTFAGGGTGGAAGTGSGGAAGAGGDPGAAPGVVNCGDSLSCDTATAGNCCVSVGLNGPSYSCSKTTCNGGGFVNITEPCDGPEDCPEGKKICCGQLSAQKQAVSCTSECKATGGGQQQGGAYQLCHKADDCTAPDTCQTCDVGQFGISLVIRVCGQQCPNQGGGVQPGG